jgi:hypothetical protein
MMRPFLCFVLTWASLSARAQSDSTRSPFTFSGYLETYYAYDFGQPTDHNRPGFVYSFNRHNEVNLNIGLIRAAYEHQRVRAHLGLMTGTYANANLAAEPGVLKNIFEANAGVKISQTKDLWVDAGIFASHIGFESAIGKDCWTLSRSILADNSPYYESGAKISYASDNGKWFVSGLVLNGWQRIQRVDGNNTPAFGHQLTYQPSSKVTLNSSSFVGNDLPDSLRRMRYFHNFYGQFRLNEKWGLIVGFDIGAQQRTKRSSDYHVWYSPVLIARYRPGERLRVAARAEYYSDRNQVIVESGTPNGFQTYGYSFNLDYLLTENVWWRVEGRGFSSQDPVFTHAARPNRQNYFVITSLAVSF